MIDNMGCKLKTKIIYIVSEVVLILLLSFVSNIYAQNQQGSSPDLGETMGNVLNEVLQDTLEEAIPGSTTIKNPVLYTPSNGQSLTHFPRNITFTWEQIPQSTYEIELDCLGCAQEGKWNKDLGQSLAYSNNITQPYYNYEFPDDRMGRWRVRAVRNNIISQWSEWSFFNFNSGVGASQQTDNYNDTYQDPGWEQQPTDTYGQDPYQDPYQNNGDSYPQDGLGEQGDYPGYDPEQPNSDVPIAEENPGQGQVAPPQAGVPTVQVNTNKNNTDNSTIKKIPKSILIKPASNSGSTSSQGTNVNKKPLYKPIDK